MEHPSIVEKFSVGLPDEKRVEVIAAFIRSGDNQQLDVDALRGLCREYLSPQMIPDLWYRVDAFPLTGSGIIQMFATHDKYLVNEYEN